ncbi:hypothetical protein GOBAR_DD27833 [Gossypium barbadense]|nr:hypothetical protein GOBAR_DD27833 [Gossypium barbadense]
MDEQLRMAAKNGDVDALYVKLAQDPYLLDRIDHLPIVDTPLHVAAIAGKHHFAMEVANLKPSLAWKLNHVGLSPMHLALQHKCTKMVRGLITINSQLIRVKAKGMITPLHYLAQTEDPDLLAELLSTCPSSIEDTTIHCETAAHVAIRNCSIRCFKVLLGWLRRVNKEDILNWKDEDAYYSSMTATFPTQGSVALTVGRFLYITFTVISAGVAYMIPRRAFCNHQKLKRRVDTMRGSSVLTRPEN